MVGFALNANQNLPCGLLQASGLLLSLYSQMCSVPVYFLLFSLGISLLLNLIDGLVDVRGHHSPPPITPASSDSPRYIPPHKRPNHCQLLETRP